MMAKVAVIGFQFGGRDDLISCGPDIRRRRCKSFGAMKVDDEVNSEQIPDRSFSPGSGINLNQDSSNYKYTHHSTVDTFDKVKPNSGSQRHSHGSRRFWIAHRPDRLAVRGRRKKPRRCWWTNMRRHA